MSDIAGAGSEVVVAAVHAAAEREGRRDGWSNNKVLLAVLPPTLALLSVAVGVWDNGNRDRAAARSEQAALEARAQQDQLATDRSQRLREAELVLPKYEDLLAKVHGTMTAIASCSADIQVWTLNSNGWGAGVGLAVFIDKLDDGTVATFVSASDAAFVESCAAIDPTLDPLRLSLDTALIVSRSSLSEQALDLASKLTVVAETARHLQAAVTDGAINLDRTDPDGRTFYDVVDQLAEQLVTAQTAAASLIDQVRGVLLLES